MLAARLMWKLNSRSKFYNRIALLWCFIGCCTATGQPCSLELNGIVRDALSDRVLNEAWVYLTPGGYTTTSDQEGYFSFKNLCPGDYELFIIHPGCTPHDLLLSLAVDTTLSIDLSHLTIDLEAVTIVEGEHKSAWKVQKLDTQSRVQRLDATLTELLTLLPGVRMLRSGAGIAKPLIQGMYGNRVSIYNHGIIQVGQQWGDDHAPEIDPSSAQHIAVVSGTSALAYMYGQQGALIEIANESIRHDEGLQGRVGYNYRSNGQGHYMGFNLTLSNPSLSGRLSGSIKRSGDVSTPRYFLNNTGSANINLAVELDRQWSDKLYSKLFASTYNATIGVLRGAHIGNLTDLQEALTRDQPFYTEDRHSYTIEAPKQQVHHHLAVTDWTFSIDHDRIMLIRLGWQSDDRQEFDVRRGGRSDVPALSLNQMSWHGEVSYKKSSLGGVEWHTGYQTLFINNQNDAETGILPLIPDYQSWRQGLFGIYTHRSTHNEWSVGLRYDMDAQYIATISRTLPRQINRYRHLYHHPSLSISYKRLAQRSSIKWDLLLHSRGPAINERYSHGLHQGVGGVEIGSPSLKMERSIKLGITFQKSLSETMHIDAQVYGHSYENYIHLSPTQETMLTIRGAFPVFEYRQVDATIAGVDVWMKWDVHRHFSLHGGMNWMIGQNWTESIPLVQMPAPEWKLDCSWNYPDEIASLGQTKIESWVIKWTHQYTSRQKRLLPEQDLISPPAGYYLMGIESSIKFTGSRQSWSLYMRIDNMLNRVYRDYLNRLRYYMDEPGRDIVIGLSCAF